MGSTEREREKERSSKSDVDSPLIPYWDPRQPPPGHRCFFALARTRPSNTALAIILCAV